MFKKLLILSMFLSIPTLAFASRDGAGTMSVTYSDFVSGTTINSTQVDSNFAEIVAEITNSLPRDGQAAPTANIPFGNYKITGLGVGTATNDSITYGQVQTSLASYAPLAGATFTGALTASGSFASTATASFSGIFASTGTSTFSGPTTFSNTLDSTGTASFSVISGTPVFLTGWGITSAPDSGIQTQVHSSGNASLSISSATGSTSYLGLGVAGNSLSTNIASYQPLNNLIFTVASAEAGRIDSSRNLLLATSTILYFPSTTAKGLNYDPAHGRLLTSNDGDGTSTAVLIQRSASPGYAIAFYQGTSVVGTIALTATNTTYNQTSDRRLKEDITPLTNAGNILDLTTPVRFIWKKQGSSGVGFIAQDLYITVPEAVTVGTDELDQDGFPLNPWAVDPSKLIPYLVAEIKSLRARVYALEHK